ncbi:MAG TPA: methionine adenosyltransferase [Bacteroidetes bacterium]|nr:methionine adenosyltransferase [Bacteroidota bacterium]
MSYLFSSESVSEGHPDKVSDQISDALLDNFLAFDPDSKVAVETLVTTGQVVVAGEVKTQTYVNLQQVIRETVKKIGYTKDEYFFSYKSLGVLSAIHDQSEDIRRGVVKINKEEQGAGDQGMMFGYASNETDTYMPLPLFLAHLLMIELAEIRKEGKKMTYLRPDSKSQVTVEYSDSGQPLKVDTLVVSTQHDEFDKDTEKMINVIKSDVVNILIPRVIKRLSPKNQKLFEGFDYKNHLFVNPTGKFVIGGPHGDTGLTGRKIIVDTYGGKGAHGGGAFSGKDPSKVDRSGAYAARHLAKNMVAGGVASEILIQVSYAIGINEPVNIYVNTYGTNKTKYSDQQIADKIREFYDLRPGALEERLKLRNPIYFETASYGHFGREHMKIKKKFKRFDYSKKQEEEIEKEVELFTWEELDMLEDIKKVYFS